MCRHMGRLVLHEVEMLVAIDLTGVARKGLQSGSL